MADIDTGNLVAIARNRPAKNRISSREQAPSLAVVADRKWQITPAYITDIVGAFDADRVTHDQMRRMRRHPMLAFGLHFIKAIIVNADWHIECDDPQVASFAEQATMKIYASLYAQMMTSLEWGRAPLALRFGMVEPKWTYTDPAGATKEVWDAPSGVQALIWKQPRLLPILGTSPKFTKNEEEFDGIEATGISRKTDSSKPLRLDRDHSLWHTNELDESRGNWYGYPRTGYALQFWWSSTYRHLLEDRHFEQDADPPLVIRVPRGQSPHPNDPTTLVDNRVLGLLIGSTLRDGGTVVMDSEHYVNEVDGRPTGIPMWDAEFLRGGENMQAFHKSNDELNKMLLRAIWVPDSAIIPNTGTGGSARAAAEYYGAGFVAGQAKLKEELDRDFNEHMLPKLLEQNFKNPPEAKIVTTGFRDEDISLAMDLLKIIVSQAPDQSQIDWRKVAVMARLPLLTLEEQEVRNKILGKVPAGGDPTDEGNIGETGGVGSADQPQGKVRNLLAAALGEDLADEMLNLSSAEESLIQRIRAIGRRKEGNTDNGG